MFFKLERRGTTAVSFDHAKRDGCPLVCDRGNPVPYYQQLSRFVILEPLKKLVLHEMFPVAAELPLFTPDGNCVGLSHPLPFRPAARCGSLAFDFNEARDRLAFVLYQVIKHSSRPNPDFEHILTKPRAIPI